MHGNHPQSLSKRNTHTHKAHQNLPSSSRSGLLSDPWVKPKGMQQTKDWRLRMGWTTWWSSRGARTRSHPELGRENPQRPWYCASRHGRVGRRQVFQPIQQYNHQTNNRGMEQPGSSSGS